jgi:hypothetical protein
MEKKFKDLKKGDSVFIVDNGEVVEAKVKDTRENWYGQFYVYTTHTNWPYCGWLGSKRAGYLFIDEEAAYEQLRKISELRKKTLEKKIDSLVSEFELLDSICQPSTVKPSTKTLSMKELKPGDSVWEVRKGDKEIREVKVGRIIEGEHICYKALYVYLSSSITFLTYPNSTRSLNALYYTDEEQAWKYMLKWKKSRMCTVGKEMEKLMRELERYEQQGIF